MIKRRVVIALDVKAPFRHCNGKPLVNLAKLGKITLNDGTESLGSSPASLREGWKWM